MNFEWDVTKAKANYRKHGLRFEEVVLVFHHPLAWFEMDENHSEDEERQKVIGECKRGIVVVIFTERNGVTRLISARFATPRERITYVHRQRI